MGKLILIIVLMLVAAAGLLVAGVHTLAGPAWAMITAAIVLAAAATVLRRGLDNG